MLGQTILLKRLHIVVLVLGGSFTHTVAWTGRDSRKWEGTTTQLCSKQGLGSLEKRWVRNAIVTSTLSIGLLFPAFADEPLLPDADQTHIISPVHDDGRLERTLESTKNTIDGKSFDEASSEGSHISESLDNEVTRSASMPQSATNGGHTSGEGIPEDNIILAQTGSAAMEERVSVPVEKSGTSQSPVGALANDDHSQEDPLSQNAEGSSHGFAYIDEIAKATSEVLAEVDTISSAKQDSPSSDSDDVRKHVAATDEKEVKVSNEESVPRKALTSVSEASSAVTDANSPSKSSDIKGDFVGNDERELEEEEYAHHELSEAQIAWLRKH